MALIYPLGLASTDFSDGTTLPGWQPHNYVYGGHISIPSSGTVTQLSVKAQGDAAADLKLGLYTSAGVLVGQTTSSVPSTATLAWRDSGAVSFSVSAGTHYVLVSASNTNARYGYDTSGNGSFGTRAYASAMAATQTISGEADTGLLYGVRLDFTAGATATAAPPPRAFPRPILMF